MSGISIGGFDIGEGAVLNRIRIITLEKVVQRLANGQTLDQTIFESLHKEAIDQVKSNYPDLEIDYTP